jgi:hypothetical protein
MTETIAPTPTPIILFQEGFLNNSNGWDLNHYALGSDFSGTGKIIGGKLELSLFCSSYLEYVKNSIPCTNLRQIPHITAKNFDLTFDTKITFITHDNTVLELGVKFRDAAGAYYSIYFSNKGTVSVYLSGNGLNDFIADNVFSNSINQGLNETNHFRIIAQDSLFIIFANDQEITRIEDGNNSSIGNISLGIQLQDGDTSGTVEIDNIQIHAVA